MANEWMHGRRWPTLPASPKKSYYKRTGALRPMRNMRWRLTAERRIWRLTRATGPSPSSSINWWRSTIRHSVIFGLKQAGRRLDRGLRHDDSALRRPYLPSPRLPVFRSIQRRPCQHLLEFVTRGTAGRDRMGLGCRHGNQVDSWPQVSAKMKIDAAPLDPHVTREELPEATAMYCLPCIWYVETPPAIAPPVSNR
jgi:hypothetical protein